MTAHHRIQVAAVLLAVACAAGPYALVGAAAALVAPCDGVWLAIPGAPKSSEDMAAAVSAEAGHLLPGWCRFASNPDSLAAGNWQSVVMGLSGTMQPVSDGQVAGLVDATYLAVTNNGTYAAVPTTSSHGLPAFDFYLAYLTRPTAQHYDISGVGGSMTGTNSTASGAGCNCTCSGGSQQQNGTSSGGESSSSTITTTTTSAVASGTTTTTITTTTTSNNGSVVVCACVCNTTTCGSGGGSASSSSATTGSSSTVAAVRADSAPAFRWSMLMTPALPPGAPKLVGAFASSSSANATGRNGAAGNATAQLVCARSANAPGADACQLSTPPGSAVPSTPLTLYQTPAEGYSTWVGYTSTGRQLIVRLSSDENTVYLFNPGVDMSPANALLTLERMVLLKTGTSHGRRLAARRALF